MSIFKNLFSSKSGPGSGPETAPVKMNLEERMAFRREMLYEAINVTMQASGIVQGSYKFRVVRNDKRGHQFLVMMDLSTDFLSSREGQPAQLNALGAELGKNALARYGLVVAAVYWRVNEHMKGVDRSQPEAAAVPENLTARQKYERATADELAAFEAAWHQGQELQVGDRVYSSDLAPLAGDASRDEARR